MNHPVLLYLKFRENDYFRPMEGDHYCLSIIDGKLAKPAWWTSYYLGEYNNNNDRLYLKILENFWALEELKPVFYAEKEKEYGKFLENAPTAFFQMPGNMIWINQLTSIIVIRKTRTKGLPWLIRIGLFVKQIKVIGDENEIQYRDLVFYLIRIGCLSG